jgi:hypothetical protein
MNRDDVILQSLVADSIQFGNISPSASFPAREQGLTNLKMIVGSFNSTTYSIIALPKFKTLEQLKAPKFAVSNLRRGNVTLINQITFDCLGGRKMTRRFPVPSRLEACSLSDFLGKVWPGRKALGSFI